MKKTFLSWLVLSGTLGLGACTKDKIEGPVISDQTLFELSKAADFKYYKNNPDTLAVAPDSPHGSFVRVRFNATAQAAMDAGLSTVNGGVFPEGSVVVKEISDTRGGNVNVLAIMYKNPGASNAGSGWLWNEVGPDGSVIYSISKKGSGCISCHSAPVNIDLVRTFGSH